MGNRTPGVLGIEPFPPAGHGREGLVPPDAGFGEPGPTGGDSGTTGPASLLVSNWPRALTWDDFPELGSRPADAEGDENAQIAAEARQPERISVANEGGIRRVTSLTVTIQIVRENCWVVRTAKSAELLSHEQGHYDLTGLMGRDMGNEILAARAPSAAALQEQITAIIERFQRRARELTRQYDTQTGGGRNREAQGRWDQAIRTAMDSGSRFSAP
jgi:hypothetical protein